MPVSTWTGKAGNGDFNDPKNWAEGRLPVRTDPVVLFSRPTVYVYMIGSNDYGDQRSIESIHATREATDAALADRVVKYGPHDDEIEEWEVKS